MNENDINKKVILHKILNSKKYNWDKKINSYGKDITTLDNIKSNIRDLTTEEFIYIMLHERKVYDFICRNGYSILATSLSYNDVLNGLLENEIMRYCFYGYFKKYLDMNSVVRHILKICNDDFIYNKYFKWEE